MDTTHTAQEGLPTVAASAPSVKRSNAGDPLATQNASTQVMVRWSDGTVSWLAKEPFGRSIPASISPHRDAIARRTTPTAVMRLFGGNRVGPRCPEAKQKVVARNPPSRLDIQNLRIEREAQPHTIHQRNQTLAGILAPV